MKKTLLLAAAAIAVLPAAAHAHRMWMVPSATVLSGENVYVTVDAAASNTLFYPDHRPMPLTNLTITAPDGSTMEPMNAATGQYRTTFDVDLPLNGTYNIENFNNTVMAVYTDENGQEQRFRGTPADWDASGLAQREGVTPTFNSARTEFFVTVGAPTEETIQPSGEGLEVLPLVHPNDLYAGETARFRLLLDGEPLADTQVEVIEGGVRYRDAEEPIHVSSDASGEFELTWPKAGMYWMHAEAGETGRGAPAGARGASYNATFEVLPQ